MPEQRKKAIHFLIKWLGIAIIEGVMIVLTCLLLMTSPNPPMPRIINEWALAWFIVAMLSQKLNYSLFRRNRDAIATIAIVNVLSSTVAIVVLSLVHYHMHLGIDMLIAGVAITCMESFAMWLLRYIFRRQVPYYKEEEEIKRYQSRSLTPLLSSVITDVPALLLFRRLLQQDPPNDRGEWCVNHAGELGDDVLLVALEKDQLIEPPKDKKYKIVINLSALNGISSLNRFMRNVNSVLETGGIFVSFSITAEARKAYVLKLFPRGINKMVYFVDYCVNRVASRIPVIRKIYFAITQGRRIVLPRAEVLGRMYANGFSVQFEQYLQDHYYVVSAKNNEPGTDDGLMYGMMIRLKRVGQHGDIIGVYKFRTMHAYSEYLQPYMYEHYKLADGGKIANDFRITTLGKFFRRTWIDELPMFINVLCGEMKIVGVRPLSQQYFGLYSKELQEMRTQTKPGMLPPYYYDIPKPSSIEEIEANEKRYLEAYFKAPLRTDWKYFWKIVGNILFKGARSA